MPDTESGLSTLRDLETRFQHGRQRPADVLAGWESRDPDLTHVAHSLRDALDRIALRHPEPAYHNRHHFAEAVLAMATLCRIACDQNLLPSRLADLGILAMIGHDFGHDGSLAPPGALEARAAADVAALAQRLSPSDRDILTHVILRTDPMTVPDNLARTRTEAATPLDWLTALANEADVLASLLPWLGLTLSDQLATEWQQTDPGRAAAVASFAGRTAFLRIYATPTRPAQLLGLDRCIADQLRALTPELDTLARPTALARFRAAFEAAAAQP